MTDKPTKTPATGKPLTLCSKAGCHNQHTAGDVLCEKHRAEQEADKAAHAKTSTAPVRYVYDGLEELDEIEQLLNRIEGDEGDRIEALAGSARSLTKRMDDLRSALTAAGIRRK